MKITVLSTVVLALALACGPVTTYVEPQGPSSSGSYARTPRMAGDTIRIVTYNIRFAENIEAATEELAGRPSLRKPDIVLLQEMDSQGVDAIARRFGFNYVYFPATIHSRHNREFGNAVLSPWPLRDARKVVLPFEQPFTKQKRIAVAVIVEVGDSDILAYSVHAETYWLSPSKRIAQIDSLARSVPTGFETVVIGGDFNMSFADHMKKAESKLLDAGFERATKGVGRTMKIGPAGWFGYALDHIFTRGLTVLEAGKEEETSASDHLPVWVTAALPSGN